MKNKKFTIIVFLLLLFSNYTFSQVIKSPEQFFGFRMGEDYKLARWDKIVEYFYLLNENSDKIVVQDLGRSTMGNPFLLAIISSPENLQNMGKYKSIAKKLSDPRGLKKEEIEKLIKEGKTVIAMSMSLHSTEVGGTQMAPELAYELITDNSDKIKNILDNVIFLLFPCFNPDGEIMVVDWYNKYLGTKYEGARLPWLYHKYTGHDNNRDGYMFTQVESRMLSKVLYQEWYPQAYVDFHHMGSYGARYYIPPYYDPLHPNIDPLIWREHQLVGGYMATVLEENGKTGIETGAPYTGWWMASFHMITNYHNIAGMLTESASANIASPVYIHPHQLRGGSRGRPEYKPQMSFPNPWPGGWWHLRDIVEQQKISAIALLDLGARFKNVFLRNMYLKAIRNIERGKNEPPYAYLIPRKQNDYLTALKLLDILKFAGVEIHQAVNDFIANGVHYPEGTFVILLAQPLRAYVKSLLERINYPDNPWTREYPGGPPRRPYDLAAFTIAEHMGVNTVEIEKPFKAKLKKVYDIPYPEGKVMGHSSYGYLLCHKNNDCFIAINRLLKNGYDVFWLENCVNNNGKKYPPGTIYIPEKDNLYAELEKIADDTHLIFDSLEKPVSGKAYKLQPLKLGMYKRYLGGNMDEGWTRWILEKFEFPYSSIYNKQMKNDDLRAIYDIIIIPDDAVRTIIGPKPEDYNKPGSTPTPPEYRGGIGDKGVKNLIKFVKEGGTLLLFNRASELAIEKMELPVSNILKGVSSDEFFCPGSTLHIKLDKSNPITYGMPENALALFWNSPTFYVRPTQHNENYKVVVQYPEENLLQSGWLIGEEKIAKKAALIEAKFGNGKIIMFGFRVQHRAQTHGTFKLLFNSIYYGTAKEVEF
ncbi:peptidase M14 family protein [candidate division KSB1 bacterium]|nr:MAG: peptidase M14 family protein [candidate division KSB1 bacterium]